MVATIEHSNPATRGGRKPTKEAKNPITRANFECALPRTGFASFRQWAIVAGINYPMFQKYTRGDVLPSMDRAARIARTGKVSIDCLFGHLGDEGEKDGERQR